MALPAVTTAAPAATYDAVIIGAGIQGLALSYELSQQGVERIAVVDRSWPGSGASGRNGELIRSAFSSPEWSLLLAASLRRWEQLPGELDFNFLLHQPGYLILATTDEQYEQRRAEMDVHRSCGVQTELLDAAQVRKLIPALNPNMVRGGLLQSNGGFAHHDAVVWAYLRAATRGGVEVFADVEVLDVESAGGRVTGLSTSRGHIATPVVVNCAGGGAVAINQMAGVDIPIRVNRLQMIVTEPIKPVVPTAVACPTILGYCHQTSRGEFVGGTELPGIDETESVHGTYDLLQDMATSFVSLFPLLGGVRVLRHWAGTVTQTADLAPVIDQADRLTNFFVSCGWVYGFMAAPATAQLLAAYIATGRKDALIAPFDIERLHTGRLIAEGSLVVPGEEHR
ncbi:FAD-binding oxidoreductase [Mycolicibacterium goodii]|uniref:NAD(P)/FAD-dependent oxidoreductase n=1 Tax=Mycolicibacterium goodii TaxID=134601 RepID=UPI001BDC430D|nr:FAD-binding oxidoreductase [Mycolicibacterium goodii]MBU8808283.1 FAD-binding oxidoreductase [Mycolicibacterium goodii]